MIRHWLQKPAAQIAVLLAALAAVVVYWGFFFDFGYEFQWNVLYTVNQTYGLNLGLELLSGLLLTIEISAVSSVIALVLGTFLGLARLSDFRPLRWLASTYVELFRNTPLLVQLFFWYFAFPQALPDNARQWVFDHNFELLTAVTGLSIYTGAFMAEIIRAGLQSIPKGLLEASYSSGLSYFQVLRKIILPVAFRQILPPLGSELLNNMKNSSLAMVVGVSELCWQSQQVESLTFRGFEATTAATLLYLVLSLTISAIMNTINGRMKIESMARRAGRPGIISRLPLRAVYRFSTWRPLDGVRAQRPMEMEPGSGSATAATQLYGAGASLRAAFRLAAPWLRLVGKGVFLAILAYLVYKVALGLFGFDWQVIWHNLPTLLIWRFPQGGPNELFWGLGGLSFSILMSIIAITVSFFIGLVVGIARTTTNRIFRIPATIYIEVIRGIPLIMVIFWVYFFVPVFFQGAFIDVFWSATLALTIFTGAYLGEIVRAGIQNIPPGQVEAALSTGLTYAQTMRKVVLPQALKQMIPAIVGQFIAIFKDTSLAYVIGVLELTFVAQGLNNRLMVYPFEIYTTVAVLYFVCCYSMSILAARLERKLSPEGTALKM